MKILIAIIITVLSLAAYCQYDALAEKAIITFSDGDMNKGISQMKKAVAKSPTELNYDILVSMHFERLQQAREAYSNQIAYLFAEAMGIKMKYKTDFPSLEECYNSLFEVCKEAELYSQCTMASQLNRNYFVDYNPDTLIEKEARMKYDSAEKYFAAEDFVKARDFYYEALSIEPRYYKATIYLGDVFWQMGMMDSAIIYYDKGICLCSDLLEPRKYRVDALGYLLRDEEAIGECYNTVLIYPDNGMFVKLSDLLKRNGKEFDRHWLPRGCGINLPDVKGNKVKNSPWSIYRAAGNEIRPYCDSKGIISDNNPLTTRKYMEIYAWEKMLKNTDPLPDEFQFAKEMMDAGFLECFVFISAFHVDFYDQFHDFSSKNRTEIIEYIEKFLIK